MMNIIDTISCIQEIQSFRISKNIQSNCWLKVNAFKNTFDVFTFC